MTRQVFENLLSEMPRIAEEVNALNSEAVQLRALEALLQTLGAGAPGGLPCPFFTCPEPATEWFELPGVQVMEFLNVNFPQKLICCPAHHRLLTGWADLPRKP